MNALKEPERTTLAEGLKFLESHFPREEAKAQLRKAFIQRAFIQSESPIFALSYDEADIDWTTGAVKILRKRDRFCPTFDRADFNAYFERSRGLALTPSPAPLKVSTTVETSSPSQPKEMLTLKPAFMGMSLGLKELFRRVKAWWTKKWTNSF
jgi:hypothetical protein